MRVEQRLCQHKVKAGKHREEYGPGSLGTQSSSERTVQWHQAPWREQRKLVCLSSYTGGPLCSDDGYPCVLILHRPPGNSLHLPAAFHSCFLHLLSSLFPLLYFLSLKGCSNFVENGALDKFFKIVSVRKCLYSTTIRG